eukprot:COSAG02_NODE_39716_length_413_cov_8.818471_1_plen_58_part_10
MSWVLTRCPGVRDRNGDLKFAVSNTRNVFNGLQASKLAPHYTKRDPALDVVEDEWPCA